MSITKQKAIEDARKMQKKVAEECNKIGKDIPKYQLSELIGKGSFGRVYKASSLTTKQLVAIKIIDIELSDNQDTQPSDTYSDLLKEINALQLLRDSGAKNINHVIEALPVGQSMWMITEYCAGGSVSTLMKPTAPGGLQEKWIIPILREVAEAMYWVHGQGIIHRDLKCANVLVTEVGNVQLCDFGVAGVIETKFDKRTTFIGTPHWMAPELFDHTTSYGTEVDIWAFGAMVFEIASGLPPNVSAGMDLSRLANSVKQNTPQLEGDQYSSGLKDLIAYCLQHDPKKRPVIAQVQRHPYIFKTEDAYPAASLAHLVRGFKLWESQGGDRRSLFSAGGAQAPLDVASTVLANDEWNFSTTADFDQQVFNNGGAQDVYDVYGSQVDFSQESFEDTSRPAKTKNRRRPPPQLPSVKAPLEKLFDPNTVSSYEDNSRAYYARPVPLPTTDLPLRDDSMPSADVRESLIDLDASLSGGDLSSFVDMDTLRAGDSRLSLDYDVRYSAQYDNAPLSDPADMQNNRRTRDWKFPTMPPPASANPEMSRFPFNEGGQPPAASAARPPLFHHPTEPVAVPSAGLTTQASDHRASIGSLIDLDMSLADPVTDYSRPSTSHSEASGSEFGGNNPFSLEKHASYYGAPTTYREPSIYVMDESELSGNMGELTVNYDNHQDYPEENEYGQEQPRPYSLSEFADMDPEFTPQPLPQPERDHFAQSIETRRQQHMQAPPPQQQDRNLAGPLHQGPQVGGVYLPSLPVGPSPQVMQGQASHRDVKEELRRMAMSLGDHLSYANMYLSGLQVRPASMVRLDHYEE
jgi:serine/threonine protein kinase